MQVETPVLPGTMKIQLHVEVGIQNLSHPLTHAAFVDEEIKMLQSLIKLLRLVIHQVILV